MGRAMRMYAVFTAFCIVPGFVCERFSHSVSSPFMGYLFLFPLLGGAVPSPLLCLLPFPGLPGAASHYAYYSGPAALTVGNYLTGVFDIYGATVPLIGMYRWAGAAFTVAGVLLHLPSQRVR